jgi:hypothetical protein
LFVGEVSTSPGGCPEPRVERFDTIGGVDDLADLGWERQERHELVPVATPHLDHRLILRLPLVRELFEQRLGVGDRVDQAHLFGDRLPVLLRHVTQCVAHQVHHTGPHDRLGPDRPDRVRQAGQPVAAHDARIENPTIAQFREHVHPLLGSLSAGRPDPHAQDVALTIEIDPHRQVDGPVADRRARGADRAGGSPADLQHDRVDQDHRPDAIQGTRLPGNT